MTRDKKLPEDFPTTIVGRLLLHRELLGGRKVKIFRVSWEQMERCDYCGEGRYVDVVKFRKSKDASIAQIAELPENGAVVRNVKVEYLGTVRELLTCIDSEEAME